MRRAQANTFVLENGHPLELVSMQGEVSARRGEPVPAGSVFVDGLGVGDIGEVVLRDRRILAETGVVTCVVILTEDGTIVAGPTISTRGVVDEEQSRELLAKCTNEVRAAIEAMPPHTDHASGQEEIRLCLRRFFRRELDRRPLVVPTVMTV